MGHVGLAKSGQVFLLVNPHDGIVGGIGQQVAPLRLQVGDAFVNLLHALHLVVGQQGTLAHEFLIRLFQQLLVFALQRVVLTVIDLTDALEERFVEHNVVFEVGQHGLHLLLDITQFGRLVGLYQGEEDAADAVEQSSALLVGQDGVLERGRVLTVHNLLDVLALLTDALLEGRQVVGRLYLAEVGCAVGQLALHEQWILTLCLLTGIKGCHHCCSHCDGHQGFCCFHNLIVGGKCEYEVL